MQKKIIALAVAGLVSGAAFADGSNVTVYGVADLSFDMVSTSGPTGAETGSYNRVSSNGSYLGFKGSEALGNGLDAVFQFENSVTADAGGMFGAARDTFAGLKGSYGSMTLGTQTTPTRLLGTQIDVNVGATSIGQNVAVFGLPGFDARHANSALYTSPNMSGFSIGAAYMAGEDKSIDGAAGTAAQKNSDMWDLGLTYANGPVLAGLTYATGKTRDVADSQFKNTRLAGAYNFGQGSVRGIWNSAKTSVTGFDSKQNTWGLGATFNVAANGKLIGQYYKTNDVSTNAGDIANTGAKLFEIGYEHSLSKRTMIKAIYARISNDKAAAFNFANNGVNYPGADIDPSGLQVGIRHSF